MPTVRFASRRVRRGTAKSSIRPAKAGVGSVLLLVPVGVLIVATLGGWVVDHAGALLAKQEATTLAELLANDLATLAVNETTLRRSGDFRLDAARLRRLSARARQSADRHLSQVFVPGTVDVQLQLLDVRTVQVEVSGRARRLIGLIGGVGGARTFEISAQAQATAHVSDLSG